MSEAKSEIAFCGKRQQAAWHQAKNTQRSVPHPAQCRRLDVRDLAQAKRAGNEAVCPGNPACLVVSQCHVDVRCAAERVGEEDRVFNRLAGSHAQIWGHWVRRIA